MRNNIVSIDHVALESLEFYCAICNEFLSPPTRVCAKGQICGKCEPDGVAFEQPMLDFILRNAKWNCIYKGSGCEEELDLHFIKEHESKCLYRMSECAEDYCEWSGLLVDLQFHLASRHAEWFFMNDLTYSDAILCKATDDGAGRAGALVRKVPFIVSYKIEQSLIRIMVTYVSPYVQQASYEIYNQEDDVTLCEGIAICHNNAAHQNVANYTVFEFKTPKTLGMNIEFTYYSWYVINEAILNILTCSLCDWYLVPAAYKCPPFGVVCGFCQKDRCSIMCEEELLVDSIKHANFPCRWDDCNAVLKAHKMYSHEEVCRFYVYHCPICKNVLENMMEIRYHLEDIHQCVYFDQAMFPWSNVPDNKMYTIKFNEVFIITYYFTANHSIEIQFAATGRYRLITVCIQFMHEHCHVKSRWYRLVSDGSLNNFNIESKSLPACFAEYTEAPLFAHVKFDRE